jgi:Adenylate and Guanylate cyclase catalytic domain
MALFGAPLAHEDHAIRACYAALAMQATLREYAETVRRVQGLSLRLRVGLNSGEVVVRTIRNDLHMDYSAVGRATHLAARLEQLAAPGSILLSTATLRLVEGLVRVNAQGPVPVKGFSEPVESFELVGVTAYGQKTGTLRCICIWGNKTQERYEALKTFVVRGGIGRARDGLYIAAKFASLPSERPPTHAPTNPKADTRCDSPYPPAPVRGTRAQDQAHTCRWSLRVDVHRSTLQTVPLPFGEPW